jgi:hypothetical protein
MAVIITGNESHLLETVCQADRRKWQQLVVLNAHMVDGTDDDYYRLQLVLPTLLSNARDVSLKKLDVQSHLFYVTDRHFLGYRW